MKDAVLGSWARTGVAAALIVVILGSVAVLGATGRLGDLRYLNIPVIHPWPPAGYFQNPFNPADRGDVLSRATADRVKADLIADGQIELQAVRTGDGSMLPQADTGNNLARLRSVLARNAADGVTEDISNQITRLVVGTLANPNDGINWSVEEVGSSRITYTRTADGSVARVEFFAFDDRFWLVEKDGHYLITDVQISSRAIQP
ncbi:MAG: hypothetical protein ACREOY_15420 [Candidatus Dormibacteraceae bacterium]